MMTVMFVEKDKFYWVEHKESLVLFKCTAVKPPLAWVDVINENTGNIDNSFKKHNKVDVRRFVAEADNPNPKKEVFKKVKTQKTKIINKIVNWLNT